MDYVYYFVFSELLTVNEITTQRLFIVLTAKVNQYIYFKGILTSKLGSQDLLSWKRDSFVSTEDENLWIPSQLMWFVGPRSPKMLL